MNSEQYEVGVLFCYIYQFDSIVNEEKKNVIQILDYIFREFDRICISNGVQKIEVNRISMTSTLTSYSLTDCDEHLYGFGWA